MIQPMLNYDQINQPMLNYDIKDFSLANQGRERIDWAFTEMPVLRAIHEQFSWERPLAGVKISGCLHITTETANLARTLIAAGAELVLCASNPLSTQDDVAAALVRHYRVPTFAICGENSGTYYWHIRKVLEHRPQLTLDDGADLVSELHTNHSDLLPGMIGGSEETTTGVLRLRAMVADNALKFPVLAVNDAMTKHPFDNRYGTGQSTLDGIIRATNILLAGKTFTVAGYGWCGRGIAMRAKGQGAQVIVTEVDPLRALEAAMDGFRVMPMLEAAECSDFIVTATGDKHVLDHAHFAVIKNGCVIANSGHFNVEINIPALEALTVSKHKPRAHVESYQLKDGRSIRLLAEGRLVNLAAAEGHPAAVMDMNFANQALGMVYLWQHGAELANAVHPMPADIDRQIAQMKLAAMGLNIDTLSPEQRVYMASWRKGA